nr:tRNA (cytidine(34)-2'-O)-methyltransferase [Deinobacterium chartae]
MFEPEMAGNVGSVARTCAVLGATLHLVRPFGFHLRDAAVQRSAMDYLEHLNWHEHRDWQALRDFAGPQARFFGFSAHATRRYTEPRYQPGDYLVFGPESRGLPAWLRAEVDLLTFPMPGQGRSLNLAVSAAVGAFEAMRQLHAW